MKEPDYLDGAGNPHYLSDGKTDPLIVWSWRVRDPQRIGLYLLVVLPNVKLEPGKYQLTLLPEKD